MDDVDFGVKKSLEEFLDYIFSCCPPELQGDDVPCPKEVNYNCKLCWKRWLDSE